MRHVSYRLPPSIISRITWLASRLELSATAALKYAVIRTSDAEGYPNNIFAAGAGHTDAAPSVAPRPDRR